MGTGIMIETALGPPIPLTLYTRTILMPPVKNRTLTFRLHPAHYQPNIKLRAIICRPKVEANWVDIEIVGGIQFFKSER